MSSGLVQCADAVSELKRRIVIFLSQKGITSVRRLNIEVKDGTVTLRGTVASFYERQLCLSCRFLPGVRKLVDELKVEIRSSDPVRPTE